LSLIVTVFLVSIAAVPFSRKLFRSSSPIPSTIPELVQLIRQSAPQLHIVFLREHLPDEGVYLCERPYPRERLQHLLRVPECGHRWRGIVYGERADRLGVIPPEELASWGEYSMQIGPLLFFGDPALLEYIRQAIHATEAGATEFLISLDGVVSRKAAQRETPLWNCSPWPMLCAALPSASIALIAPTGSTVLRRSLSIATARPWSKRSNPWPKNSEVGLTSFP
jgi:hypothetical protein